MSAVEVDILEVIKDQAAPDKGNSQSIFGIVVAKLVGFLDDGRTPLVTHPGRSAAIRAQTIVDLHGAHIGHEVIVQFAQGNPQFPVVMGLLRNRAGWPLAEQPAQVDVDVDGERMTVSAKEQLVLRCGKASLTLTKAGKILIHGTYVSSRSSGVMRIKGGSVQLN